MQSLSFPRSRIGHISVCQIKKESSMDPYGAPQNTSFHELYAPFTLTLPFLFHKWSSISFNACALKPCTSNFAMTRSCGMQ